MAIFEKKFSFSNNIWSYPEGNGDLEFNLFFPSKHDNLNKSIAESVSLPKKYINYNPKEMGNHKLGYTPLIIELKLDTTLGKIINQRDELPNTIFDMGIQINGLSTTKISLIGCFITNVLTNFNEGTLKLSIQPGEVITK